MASHNIKIKIANSKYAASYGFQIAADNGVWLCYLVKSNSEMVNNFGDNFRENSMSYIGK